MSNGSSDLTVEGGQPKPKAGVWPHPLLALVLTSLLFIGGQIFSALVVSIVAAITGESGQDKLFGSPIVLQFVYALAAYGSMLLVIVWFLRRRGLTLASLGLKKARLSDAGWTILAFMVYASSYALLVSVLSPLIPGLDVNQRQDTGFAGANGLLPLVMVGFTLVVLAPFTEEVLMRGFLFGSLRKKLPFILATLITSAVFGSFHLWGGEAGAGPIWIAAIDTFVLSFALCYLREKTGRLWASIALHMIKNAIAFTFLFIVVN